MGTGGSRVVVAGIVVLAACSGATRASSPPTHSTPRSSTSGPSSATTARPRATSTAPAPHPTPVVSFDDSVAPPKLVNTGTDYEAIVRSLEGYATWLSAHHPDPALAPVTVASGTRLYNGYLHDLSYLRDRKLRYIEKLDGRTTVTIVSATADAFSARFVEHITARQVVDRSGRVMSDRRVVGPTTYLDVFVLAHGRWYLAASDAEKPPVVHL